MDKITIMLVDDHVLFRSCLREVLSRQDGFQVIGEAGNGREAVELYGKVRPGLVVMDVAMPLMNGIEASRQIVEKHPNARILALSMHRTVAHARGIIQAGASGYALKTRPISELFVAIRTVYEGNTFLTPEIAQVLVMDYRNGQIDQGGFATLTKRQREVLQLVAEGHTTKAIASLLDVSSKTVESHRTQLMEKLHLHSIAELTRYALREGLTSDEVV